jgi:hypothetical protein
MMAASVRPARAADVAKPARSEWPAKSPATSASAARSRTIVAMAVGETRADVAMAINAPEHDVAGTRGAANVEPGAHRARRFFRTGRDRDGVAGGILIRLRAPDGQLGPFGSKRTSSTRRAASSERRRAAAQPTSSSARSRRPRGSAAIGARTARSGSRSSAVFCGWATPELAAQAAHDGPHDVVLGATRSCSIAAAGVGGEHGERHIFFVVERFGGDRHAIRGFDTAEKQTVSGSQK